MATDKIEAYGGNKGKVPEQGNEKTGPVSEVKKPEPPKNFGLRESAFLPKQGIAYEKRFSFK
jgi:hypothetical protein